MEPVFFELDLPVIGEVAFTAYFTMLMVGFVVAISMARRHGERIGMNGDDMVDLGLFMLVLGILGGRLLAVLTDGKLMDFVHLCTDPTQVPAVDSRVRYCGVDMPCDYDYVCDVASHTCHPPRDCLAALKFWQGGLTFYGGLLLAVPGGLWYARKKRMGTWRTADVTAPAIVLGLFFGRLGCFFNGCCYGAAVDGWPGVRLPGHMQPVHPTQLYEAAGALVLFWLLHVVIRPRKRGHGEVFGWLLVLYGVMRMIIELVRADERGAVGPLSTSQIISIPLIAAGAYLVVSIRRRAQGDAVTDSGGARKSPATRSEQG